MIRLNCYCNWDFSFHPGEEMGVIAETTVNHFIRAHGMDMGTARNRARRLIEDTMSSSQLGMRYEERWDENPKFHSKVLGNFEESNTEQDINTMKAKAVQVRYTNVNNSSQPYTFFTDIEGLQDGDTVVVRDANGLSVVTVLNYVKDAAASKAKAWVIDKVDFTAEKRRAKKAKLELELKKAIEATSILERAKQLADLNPDLAAMIKELEELG